MVKNMTKNTVDLLAGFIDEFGKEMLQKESNFLQQLPMQGTNWENCWLSPELYCFFKTKKRSNYKNAQGIGIADVFFQIPVVLTTLANKIIDFHILYTNGEEAWLQIKAWAMEQGESTNATLRSRWHFSPTAHNEDCDLRNFGPMTEPGNKYGMFGISSKHAYKIAPDKIREWSVNVNEQEGTYITRLRELHLKAELVNDISIYKPHFLLGLFKVSPI